MISNTGGGNFIYLSNKHGLEFSNGVYKGINNLSILNDNFYINNQLIIKNNKNMRLTYDGINDKLIIKNKTHTVWEIYGNKPCNNLISNNDECNNIYSLNSFVALSNSIDKNNDLSKRNVNGVTNNLHLSSNLLLYNNDKYYFNITKYLNLEEPLFSHSLNENGNIFVNNNKYILHEEYYKQDKYYELINIDDNLILKSSTGEYKWTLKNIYNRPFNSSEIKIGDSFREGEMLYCGNYSMIILNGKLLYRDHKSKISTEIKYSKNNSSYLYKIVVGSNNISFKDKTDEDIYNIYYNKISKNSKLYCDKNTRSIVWKIDNTIKWKYPEISSNNGDLQDKNAENLLDAWK
ncbi:hypothetical protein H8356DRAFT_1374453 [Neocallimastix lanati (nom. inval.)]|nr:hypothetical protein H8356DRAFT_1374453 [Neocallimastix sp. JGI-2020a]